MFILIFTKTEIARSVRGLKLQGLHAEDAMAKPSCWKFWWFDNSRSQGPQWQLRISKQSSICSRGAGLGHPMDPVVSLQNKNFSGNPEKLAKVLGAKRKPKVIYTDNSLEFGKVCEDLSWIIARQHLTVQKQLGLLREQHAGLKKVRLQYCCNQVWMKNGGRIPWNASAICETLKISCLMGRHPWKGGSECLLTDQ